ncbi:phosphatase PAP2 family protein [Cellulomonas fimi]|uniref:phosphatase PAP2 family protein n=1 Tax=Cellulomonas fimi TaxID=1708 RepID=UPI0003007C4F|nr:phosphatase PAP2 family protein [Cellulomonas fimi]NNH08782.1 phosphatase PAP2 family protein [Cellulomonas fimi]
MSSAPVTRPAPVAPTRAPSGRAGVVLGCLLVAVASAVGVWALWRVFVTTTSGQVVELAALRGAEYGQTQLWRVAERVLDVVSVGFIAAVILAAMTIAVLRRRWELALQVAVLMVGANVTTRVLKLGVLERPELDVAASYGNTLPSGHTTAAASVSVALLLVVPPRVRPWAAVAGAGYTTATGVSTLIGQWHRPSDVVAGVLVVLGWGAVACALVALTSPRAATSTGALRRVDDGVRPAGRRSLRVAVTLLLVVGAAAAGVAALALSRTWQGVDADPSRADQVLAYAGGASGALAAACMAFAVLLVLRQAAAARLPES